MVALRTVFFLVLLLHERFSCVQVPRLALIPRLAPCILSLVVRYSHAGFDSHLCDPGHINLY